MLYIKLFNSTESAKGYETTIPFIGSVKGKEECIYCGDERSEFYNILEENSSNSFINFDGGWYMYYDTSGKRHPVIYSGTTMPSFQKNKDIKKMVIGDEITTIQGCGLQYCTNLTSVILPESIKAMGDQCFEGCISLKSITIPKSVTSIGAYLPFQGDYNLEKIIVESGNTVYDSRDNCNCIIITKTNSILAGCKGCSMIPEGVVTTEYGAFYNHSGLKSITLPSTMKSVGGRCFAGCSLTGITFPESMTYIGYESFGACYAIKDINIPKNVSSIGDYPFASCNNLTAITVDADNKWYDSRENCNAIIRTSDGYLVQGCKTTIIPEGVKTIGKVAFRSTGMSKGLKMPSTINCITSSAFMWCGDLGDLDFSLVTVVPTLQGTNAFNGTPSTMKIIVPDDLYDDWIIATNWSTYASRIVKVSEYNA